MKTIPAPKETQPATEPAPTPVPVNSAPKAPEAPVLQPTAPAPVGTKLNADLHLDVKQVTKTLPKLLGPVLTLGVMLLFGYTVILLSHILSVTPDSSSLDQKTASTGVTKLDVKTIRQLSDLQNVSVAPVTGGGKSDPFAQ